MYSMFENVSILYTRHTNAPVLYHLSDQLHAVMLGVQVSLDVLHYHGTPIGQGYCYK